MKHVYLLMAFVLCMGCSREPGADVRLNILPAAGDVIRIHVDFEGVEFDVPEAHVPLVLEALQPTSMIREQMKCVVIADVSIESKDAPKLDLIVHTRNHPSEFAAHSVGITDNYVNYRGTDATRLTKVLKAAREAAQSPMPAPDSETTP